MRLRLRCLSCISSSSPAYCSTSILERCDLCGEVLGVVCFFSSSGFSFWKQRRRHRRDNFLTFCTFLATEISESVKCRYSHWRNWRNSYSQHYFQMLTNLSGKDNWVLFF